MRLEHERFILVGGVFNPTNGGLYCYAGNNPVRYVDPDGREIFLNKEKHYTRNNHQKTEEENFTTREIAEKNGFIQLGKEKGEEYAEKVDAYHEMGRNKIGAPSPKDNDKLVKREGESSLELVYDGNGNLVTDSVNQGTYNFCDPEISKMKHFLKDVLPYYLWGNSPDDPTSMSERVLGTYQGDINASKEDAAKERMDSALREAHVW